MKALPTYRTPWVTPKGRAREWFLVDATGIPLGRLASQVARLLRGKHLPYFAPQWNLGAAVIIINAEKVALTGKKAHQKTYTVHTGYPGGQKHIPLKRMTPAQVIRHAIKGMLPKNRLQARMLRNLFIYEGEHHPHAAQQPKPIAL